MRADTCPVPRFTDPDRVARLRAAFPEIDRILRDHAQAKRIPGMIWGVVIDGETAHIGEVGVANLESGTPVDRHTAFRIASMTKSVTALAILKLRDDGHLSLEDPVARWVPAFASVALPTRDSAPVTIRQLLSNHAGFPEDNPWGDRQLDASDGDVDAWIASGLPFSTAPGTRYEYSNYGWSLLGRVVAAASGTSYRHYVESHILRPLGMLDSTFEPADVPTDRRAAGYHLTASGQYQHEPPLAHGAFGPMGGLVTTASDLGRYVAFHLSAWPPRDDEDAGPVRRASVREMAHLGNVSTLVTTLQDGTATTTLSGYGFGLRVMSDCRFERVVAHGGGLPGFGSYMAWLPEHGVGLFALSNLTYAGPHEPVSRAWDSLLATGALRRRELPASAHLESMREVLLQLWERWDETVLRSVAADNLLLDTPAADRERALQSVKDDAGACRIAGPVMPENWLRGQFNMTCERGTVGVFFTLSPTSPPRVQHVAYQRLSTPGERMTAPTGPPAGVSCPGANAQDRP